VFLLTTVISGVVGFVRSYGKYLPEEGITLNAVCPNVVRTKISTDVFYDKVEGEGVLTPMKGVVDAFASFLDTDTSGECMEVGPNGGFGPKAPAPHLDKETTRILDMIHERSHRLHEPEQ
jgi:NAD(P)-dependent dehydrogenase (short-subunit alcohol dehydrogenase family)